jgi:hypothetical protein
MLETLRGVSSIKTKRKGLCRREQHFRSPLILRTAEPDRLMREGPYGQPSTLSVSGIKLYQ